MNYEIIKNECKKCFLFSYTFKYYIKYAEKHMQYVITAKR